MSIQQVNQYLSGGQLQQALVLTQQLLQQSEARPNSNDYQGELWKLLFQIYHQQQKNELALKAVAKAAELLPGDISVQLEYGRGLFQMEQLDLAGQHFHKLLQRHSELVEPYVHLAKISEKKQQSHEVEFYYSKALTLDSEELFARAGLGVLTMHQGKLPEAIIHYRHTLSLMLKKQVEFGAQKNNVSEQAQDSQKEAFDKPEYETLLWQALALLAQHGVHAFATAGTLLGLIREGKLLPFDKDIDIALPYREMAQAKACLEASGWIQVKLKMPLVNPVPFKHLEHGLVLDLCGVEIEQGTEKVLGGFWLADVPWEWQRVLELPSPLNLQLTDGPYGKVWALKDPETWLESYYGDWRTPDPDFDTTIYAKNQRSFSLLTQCYAFNRLIHLWHQGKTRKVWRIAQYLREQRPDDVLFQQTCDYLAARLEKR